VLTPAMFAEMARIDYTQVLVNLIAGLAGGFSDVVGSTGTDATLLNFLSAKRALHDRDVPGPYLAVLHPTQWSDIIEDWALNSGGAVQFDPAAPEMLRIVGNGYQGRLAGVDVFTTTRVTTANVGADRAGGMFGRGAIGWAFGSPPVDFADRQLALPGGLLFEIDRDADAGVTVMHEQIYLGAAELEDDAGVSIITDA